MEGQPTAPELDLNAVAGFETAYRFTEYARVTDGSLSISVYGTVNHALMNAFVVRREDSMDGVYYAINSRGGAYIDSDGIRYDADEHHPPQTHELSSQYRERCREPESRSVGDSEKG